MSRFGSTALLAFTDLVAFYVYGRFFALSWLLAGVALSISYIVIGTTHWLIGYRSDQLRGQRGRRKPFIILGAPGLAMSCFLLFVPNWFLNTALPEFQVYVFVYYMVFLCLMKFFYATLLTTFQAWMPEITEPAERPLISSLENTANWIATGVGIGLAFIIPLLIAPGPPPGLTTLGLSILLAFCIVTVIVYFPALLLVGEKKDIVLSERELSDETKFVLNNRDYVGWLLAIGFLSFTFAGITATIVGFSREVLMLDTIEELAIPAGALVISILFFLFIWTKLIARRMKGKVTAFSMIALGLLLFSIPVVVQSMTLFSPTILGTAFFILLAAFMSVYYLMSYIVPADIAHADQIITGVSRAGIYEGFKGVPYNFSQALSALFLGVILDYSKTATGNEVFGLIWWAPLYAPFLFLGALVLRYIDIDPNFEGLEQLYSKKGKKKKSKR